MMRRKIIQLAPVCVPDEALVMYVLCDDGTWWMLVDGNWLEMKNVPQSESL